MGEKRIEEKKENKKKRNGRWKEKMGGAVVVQNERYRNDRLDF